jgi:hypothetical protein
VPHPAAFALHKLLVVPRRREGEKKRRDLDSAVTLLDLLEKKGELGLVVGLMRRFPKTWRKVVLSVLEADGQVGRAAQLGG